uniref:uncharacterized protein isoform X1 n=1 Tax=Myxine glutinosa TaxID=7769 RepID=UPI00358F3323
MSGHDRSPPDPEPESQNVHHSNCFVREADVISQRLHVRSYQRVPRYQPLCQSNPGPITALRGMASRTFCACVLTRSMLSTVDWSPPKFPMVVSGVVTKGDKDFTPQAAQVAHQKPLPKTEKHNITQQKMPINQPRK